jgi:hypothetical protein|tara:strand:+ start:57 stop:398 length:342 start_codon:yes stop_codon:yes gene_type:complete
MFAMKMYDNPQCKNIDEFYEDLDRIKYVKRLLHKYINRGVLRERLILNHIIVLTNLFTPLGSTKMLFYKLDEEMHPPLKTFLLYLNYLPDEIEEVPLSMIESDLYITKRLREI